MARPVNATEVDSPDRPRLKVLFIAGTGRSGSTLLANLLGQLPGFFCGGELRYVWERGVIQNRRCGCGQPFNSCPEWQAIVHGPLGPAQRDWASFSARQERRLRARALPRTLASRPGNASTLDELEEVVRSLYTSVRSRTGCRVLVDSSKLPSYAMVLEACPELDVRILHLVRDPRAVAFSWLRSRELTDVPGRVFMPQRRPIQSTLDWMLWNGTAEILWSRRSPRYLRVRYEDLVDDPPAVLQAIATLLDEPAPTTELVRSGFADLRPTHSVAGNPGRMQTGRLAIRPDSAWVEGLEKRHRQLVTALAGPMIRHYGYPLRLGSSGHA